MAYHAPEGYDNSALKVLVDTGKLNDDTLATMLVRKADWHDDDGIKLLLQNAADPNRISGWGFTALHHAARRDNALGIFELLLNHGGDPTIPSQASASIDAAEKSTVFIAARRGRGDLLDLGVDIEELFAEGDGYWSVAKNSRALHVAAWRGRHTTVKFLLERGAQVNVTDGEGRTPLALAVKACVDSFWTERRSPESVAALLRAGASPNNAPFPSGYAEVDDLLKAHGK